jgi:dienelactone hydrolase
MDYLETDPDIDARKVSLMGFSRFGKTAMWAGAQDERLRSSFPARLVVAERISFANNMAKRSS